MRSLILTAAMTAFALTLSASAEEKAIKLKQGFPVGKKIHQSIVMNQKMKMGGIPGAPGGGEMNMTNRITMDTSMDIKKHGEDQKKAIMKYEKMGMLMDAGVFKQEFNSDDVDQEGNPFAGIVGKAITLIYDKDDQIQSVEGMDALMEWAATEPGVGEMLKQIFSEEQMKQMMNQGLLQMVPDKALTIGDSWHYTMETPLPQGMGKMKVSGQYTLKKFDEYDGKKCVVIGMEGKLETDGKSVMELQGQKIEMEFGESKFEGDIYFDNELGLPRKSDMLTKMKMNMKMAAGINMSMDMNMTMINKITKIEESK
ncbi:MAG: hypothetical protein ACI8T1_003028 [Verrucomicrobiales bacterium]|jgi:hypothetical protein